MKYSISFVLPAFNEAENIAESIRRCVAVGQAVAEDFEVLVVDDGSRDGTRRIADGIADRDHRVRTLHHPRNRGYGAALKTGLLAARMDKVFFTDADLQFDVAQVRLLLHHSDRFGIVAGYRSPRRDPLSRKALGWGWSRLVGWLFDLEVRDVDCAFKVFDRRIFDRISISAIGALVNTEILVRARAEGFSLKQVPVRHYPRTAGTQTGASPRVVLKALSELADLHDELHDISRPAEIEELA